MLEFPLGGCRTNLDVAGCVDSSRVMGMVLKLDVLGCLSRAKTVKGVEVGSLQKGLGLRPSLLALCFQIAL